MLFNKWVNGSEELRELTSSFYKNNDFSRISTQVMLEEEALTALVGGDVIARALAHYHSAAYDKTDPSAEDLVNNQLVRYLQMPIAYRATFRYYQLNLVSHEDTGRKVKMNRENESMPWEWMLDRDDAAQVRIGNETADMLIRWMESKKIAEWMNSDARRTARQLFVNTAALFQDSYPIDLSERFFYTALPFNKEIQTIKIKKALGIHYTPLLERWTSSQLESGSTSGGGGIPEENLALEAFYEDLLLQVQKVIPLLVMVMAVKRLSLQLMPDGVVQHFRSATAARNASQPALPELMNAHAESLQKEALYILDDIKKLIQSANPEAGVYQLLPVNKETNKYFRT